MEINDPRPERVATPQAEVALSVRLAMPLLVLLSGFCGISYEILYTKLLGNLLGQQFIINATVLLTFLLGIGFGTLYAHRFARWLWAVEGSIGLYAALMVLTYGQIESALYTWLPSLGTSIYACALVSLVLLAVPAFLIGCSLPLFAAYLGSMRKTRVFSLTYGIYNLGAAITALAMEFVLLRSIGLRAAVLTLAGLNVVVALSLLGIAAPLVPAPPRDRLYFPKNVLAALALASVASAIFQLLMIKLAEFLFGPYNETFSLVLATVLLGLAVGSYVCGKLQLSFTAVLTIALFGLAWLLAFLPTGVTLYASLYPGAAQSYFTLVLLKFALVLVLMGLPAVGFGATIPALLFTHRDVARESGQLLFFSSVANAVGFMLMAFFLHQYLDYGPILLLITVLTAVAFVLYGGLRRVVVPLVLVALAVGATLTFWDETFLYLGHTKFHSPRKLASEKKKRVLAERFKGPQDVFAIIWKDGDPHFFINGYISIPIAGENASEKLVGAMSGMMSPRLDEALVLGLGSGATAGSVGLIFDKTDVVEINRVVLNNQFRMAEYNFDVANMPSVNIIHDDGIHHIKTTPKRYSLILNTVTTPLYFSSSKLYTRDFLQSVKGKLTPDGVYVTWVDGRIGDRGMDIILHTLADTFSDCWLYYLDATYFLMTCADGDLALHNLENVSNHPRLRKHFAEENGLLLSMLPYSIISTDAAELRSTEDLPINTLDYPILEFEMSKLQEYTNLNGFKREVEKSVSMKRTAADVAPAMRWDPAEMLFFTDLRVKSTWIFSRILFGKVHAEFGEMAPEAYERVALESAEQAGTPQAQYMAGRRLLTRDRLEPAAQALARALEMDPTLDKAHFHYGRAQEKLGNLEDAIEAYQVAWEQHQEKRVPLRIVGVLMQLDRSSEALAWLDRVESNDRKSDRFSYVSGLVHEKLGDLEIARKMYRAALKKNPDSKDAALALRRVRGAAEQAGSPGSSNRP